MLYSPGETARTFATPQDLEEFVSMLERYERGEVSADEWKRFRLVRGIYGQRQQGPIQMIRVKIPQGVLLSHQLEKLADVAEQYSRGFGHVTTRQNIQFHFVKLADCTKALADLTACGLTTREACGNTVRNITACEFAGVCSGEAFDVTPYGEALTRTFLRREPFFDLARKFKIALSGCPHDCAQGAIHDIGLLARMSSTGERGFRVRVGGGLSTRPTEARVLEEFVPIDELIPTCEAILWVFYRHGNRQNKARARLKYVILTQGWDFFVAEYRKALDEIRMRGAGKIPIEVVEDQRPTSKDPTLATTKPPASWVATNARAQKQAGYHAVTVRLRRGDLTAAQMRGLAQLARTYGDGTARTQAHDQNLVLRWIASDTLGALYQELVSLGLHEAGAATIVDTTSCPGAESCQLAYTTSRDLAADITARLESADAAIVKATQDAKIKISGCPNSCGRHHIATIGWHGGVKRVGNGVIPVYQLHLGGGVNAEGARFGRQIVKIPARRVSLAVVRLLELYAQKRQNGESAQQFYERVPDEDVRKALDDLAVIDETHVNPEDFIDLGQSEAVKVEMGPGECAT